MRQGVEEMSESEAEAERTVCAESCPSEICACTCCSESGDSGVQCIETVRGMRGKGRICVRTSDGPVCFYQYHIPAGWVEEWERLSQPTSAKEKRRKAVLLAKLLEWVNAHHVYIQERERWERARETSRNNFAATLGITLEEFQAVMRMAHTTPARWQYLRWCLCDWGRYPLVDAKRKQINDSLRRDVIRDAQGICAYCSAYSLDYHLDHRIPVCRGGLTTRDNLVYACRKCNAAKGRATEDEYRAARAHSGEEYPRMIDGDRNDTEIRTLLQLEQNGYDIFLLGQNALAFQSDETRLAAPAYPDTDKIFRVFSPRQSAGLAEPLCLEAMHIPEDVTDIAGYIAHGNQMVIVTFAGNASQIMQVEECKNRYPLHFPALAEKLQEDTLARREHWRIKRERAQEAVERKMQRARKWLDNTSDVEPEGNTMRQIPNEYPGITMDPDIMQGEPVIAGTRIPVALILAQLAADISYERLERDYHLTLEHVRAALAYAAELRKG